VTGEPMVDINRAVGRLVSQAYKAAWRLADEPERAKQIAEALERAAQQIADLMKRETVE
jgi:hypothetical protein